MDCEKIFETIKRNSIHMRFDANEKKTTSAGVSKFGGEPHLPAGFEWPYYAGEDYNGETANRPLSFLLQIDCADIAPFDEGHELPQTGVLYFFYELMTMPWGYDPKDKGCARVYYEPGYEIKKTPFPAELREECRLPEFPVVFSAAYEVPEVIEYEDLSSTKISYDDWDDYTEQRERFTGLPQDSDDAASKLLGYADIIQNAMLRECELSTRGIYNGSAPIIIPPEQKDAVAEGSKQWRLLMQLDTVSGGDFELMFGDCGRIYFYIREEDMKNRAFEKSWLVLQCY